METHYDYIIAGAGAAGLSLLWHLTNSRLNGKNVLLLDRSLEPKDDKTWCFWDNSNPFSTLATRRWSCLEVVSMGETFSGNLTDRTYQCIRSDHYQNFILGEARQNSRVTFLETDIQQFDSEDKRGIVQTGSGNFTADWIFQSVKRPVPNGQAAGNSSLIQHFTGWEIESDKACFDPRSVLLMDFDTPQKDGLTFFYLLPFTDRHALVEYTLFSGKKLPVKTYESAIQHYLSKRFGLGDNNYDILRKESGVIPMEGRPVPGSMNPRTINLGTAGGATKSSTGYTFTRIHQHSRQIVKALEGGMDPEPFSGSPFRYRLYDLMLLYLLEHEQESAREVFHSLFENNEMESVLKFMGEETTIREDVSLISTLPYKPFLKSIYHLRKRILKGI